MKKSGSNISLERRGHDEQQDNQLQFFSPHTQTMFLTVVASLAFISLTRHDSNFNSNLKHGIYLVVVCFLIISLLAFPKGPFTRPHPAIWKIVFGVSVMYFLFLVFALFQNYRTIREMLRFISPDLTDDDIEPDYEHGVNCSLTFDNIKAHLDIYVVAHFVGWIFQAILVRNIVICLAVSILWEVTEVAFNTLLPIFNECWWDSLIMDFSICNFLGMLVGLQICKILDLEDYKWVSIRNIPTAKGKVLSTLLQFTPKSWAKIEWMDPSRAYIRYFAITLLVVFWLLIELNTFFLKALFLVPTSHPLVILRLIFVFLVTAPSVKQYYDFISLPDCKELGTQCWVCGGIVAVEALLVVSNWLEKFNREEGAKITYWLCGIFVLTCILVYGCVLWDKYFAEEQDTTKDDSPIKSSKVVKPVSEDLLKIDEANRRNASLYPVIDPYKEMP